MAAGAEPDPESQSRSIPTGIIRAYRTSDREAVREICRKTAYRNRGASSVFEDGEAFADYWTSYYTDEEPDSALVVEENGKVVGYLLGCADSARFVHIMSRRIVPRLVLRMLGRLISFRYKQKTTRRVIYWFLFYSWRESPGVPIERYPAHYHCNILREGYGRAYYTRMAGLFLDRLERLGVNALHGQILEAAEGGPWRKMADSHPRIQELEYYAETPSSFHRIAFGENVKMVNRAWGLRVDDYRDWLSWMATKYRL